MRRYGATGETPAGTTLTIIQVEGKTTTRGWLYDIVLGSDSAPTDVATDFEIIRSTALGTGTSVTPQALDGGNPAALLTAQRGTFTGQTKTANSQVLKFGLNQRATFRWVAVPGGEIVVPATATAAVLLESLNSGGTPNICATLQWEE
jgi:hypothetical protein